MTSPELLAELTRWANINSGSNHLAGLQRMCGELAVAFRTLPDASVETVPLPGTAARAIRVRLRPDAGRQILFSGHYDTVYGADHPFQRCLPPVGGRLRGPGVADMKGGLLVMLAGLRLFAATPECTSVGCEIVVTPDEEIGSPYSRALLEQTARDGCFGFGLVFEPARANGDLVRTRKGTGVFEITCHGRASHAGRDLADGRNAILALGEFLHRATARVNARPGVSLSVGSFHGGGPVNIVPDLARAQVDVRTASLEHETWVRNELAAIAAVSNAREGYLVEITGGFNRPPKTLQPFDATLFDLWQTCAWRRGLAISWQDVGGASDGNLLCAAGLPTLDGLGPVGDRVHTPDEFVVVASLAERAALLADALSASARADFPWPHGRERVAGRPLTL